MRHKMPIRFTGFDWDEYNKEHISKHNVIPDEEVKMSREKLKKPKALKKLKQPIPDFETEKEEQEFWATHSSLDYEMELVAENFEVDEMARTQSVCIRLEKWLIRDLKELAVEEGYPYQTIIKECLKKLVGARKRKKRRMRREA